MSTAYTSEDLLIRMQRDLKRAQTRNPADIRWTMVIDQAKCAGCYACTIGCVAENKLPPGVVYRPVIEEEIGTFPNVRRRFTPKPCMHCMNAPCTQVCPVEATYKNAQGVTVIDYDKCIGCRYCIVACPYGSRTFDFGDFYTSGTPDSNGKIVGKTIAAAGYEINPAAEYGKKWVKRGKDSPVGNARKCHFCLHRLSVGMLPSCTTTCIGRATYFGDRNDGSSLVAELMGSPRAYQLMHELGTEPSVYYLR